LEKLQAVTAADVQRVASKYFTDKNRYVFVYLPDSLRPASGAEADKIPLNDKHVQVSKAYGDPFVGEGATIHRNVRSAPKSGEVTVQILTDEQANVIRAKAVSGDPELRKIAEKAAKESRSTTRHLEGVPVQVNAVLIYNFIAQEDAKK